MKHLRMHSSATVDGRLFVQFIALIYISALRREMRKSTLIERYTVRELLQEMDRAIRRIEELGPEGRAEWKKEIGYHRRSRVETLMFRYKTILGDRLVTRRRWSQATEVAIKLDVLNRMTELGMPQSQKAAG